MAEVTQPLAGGVAAAGDLKPVATADPVPFDVAIGEAATAAYLAEKKPTDGVVKAAEVILRAAPEAWVRAGKLVQLADKSGAAFASLIGLRPKGYVVIVVTATGVTHVYRILKHKPAADGGNDYVPIDSWEPLVAE